MQQGHETPLIAQAIHILDDILDRHARGFVHLDRGALIGRIERIREAALLAKLLLEERRGGAAVPSRLGLIAAGLDAQTLTPVDHAARH